MKKTIILWSFYILSLMLVNVLQAKVDKAENSNNNVKPQQENSKDKNEEKRSSKKSKHYDKAVGIIGLGGFVVE